MRIIKIRNQRDFDNLPSDLDEKTEIHIHTPPEVWLSLHESKTKNKIFAGGNSLIMVWGNSSIMVGGNCRVLAREKSSVIAKENSSVEAWENSSVDARGDSSVIARENSTVTAWENSSVDARGNNSIIARGKSLVAARGDSSVIAWEKSSIVAWQNSSVVARGNSSVEARENSFIVAEENSSVVAWENSFIEARENSSVVAQGNSTVRLFNQIKKLTLKKFAVAISVGFEARCDFKAETARLISQPVAMYSKEDFLAIHAKNIQPDGRVLFYKVTQHDDTDYFTTKIIYKGIVTCPDWDPDCNRQCGGGLHLSPTKNGALSYHSGKVKKCLVRLEDFVVHPYDISKVRCREVEVL
jgi:hypothetical protein